jgi:hypothetical protein
MDLGTHIFFKSANQRPKENFHFYLKSVTDEKVEDDLDNYSFTLSD